jgi:hypothetical protein
MRMETPGAATLLLLALASYRRSSIVAAGHLIGATSSDAVAVAAASPISRHGCAGLWFGLALALALGAALSKETGALALVLCAAEDLLHQPVFLRHFGAGATASRPAHHRRPCVTRGWLGRTAISAGLTVAFLLDAQRRRGALMYPRGSYIDNPLAHGWAAGADPVQRPLRPFWRPF